MRYDPQSLWAATLAWWLREHPQDEALGVRRSHMLQLYIYVRAEEEPYYLAGPKLYRLASTDPHGSFVNCEQDELADAANRLGHVIARSRLSRAEHFWPTWAEFAQATGLAAL